MLLHATRNPTWQRARYPPFSNDVQFFGKVCNYIFTAVFFVEFVLMIIAIGPKKYLTTLMTFVDALIVISSIVELYRWSA